MARRTEGTVASGFVCDEVSCGLNAIWAVTVLTPYVGQPRPPILTMTDVHVCQHHWRIVRRDITTDHMREAIRSIADSRGGVPDFERQWIGRIGVHHGDYHVFQERAGLIAPGDMMVKSDAAMPEF